MTAQPLPSLLQPYHLHDLVLANRMVMAPLTRGRAGEERIPNALMETYYTQRASAGLIISEATSISQQGLGWLNSPGIYTPEQVDGWRRITDAVHAQGGKIFLQLWHCGRASHSSFQVNGQLPVSASNVPIVDDVSRTPYGKQPYEAPRPLETEEVAAVVRDYAKAAENAKLAGFDGVEIHAANGYLIDQFIQSITNQRTDRYGGSLENRLRFLMEITEAVCQVWPSNRVGVRLSPNGRFNDMGDPNYRETFLTAASKLNQFGLSYLHVVDGTMFGTPQYGEPMTLREFRWVFDGPLMGNMGYLQDTAQAVLDADDADLIAFGRPFITNPDLVERFTYNYPLAPYDDVSRWYTFDAAGYTDYPAYEPHTALKAQPAQSR